MPRCSAFSTTDSPPTDSDLFWLGLIVVGCVYEVQALARKRDDDTLSRRTRYWTRSHTPWGRAAFVAGWSAFAGWYMWHIVRGE